MRSNIYFLFGFTDKLLILSLQNCSTLLSLDSISFTIFIFIMELIISVSNFMQMLYLFLPLYIYHNGIKHVHLHIRYRLMNLNLLLCTVLTMDRWNRSGMLIKCISCNVKTKEYQAILFFYCGIFFRKPQEWMKIRNLQKDVLQWNLSVIRLISGRTNPHQEGLWWKSLASKTALET